MKNLPAALVVALLALTGCAVEDPAKAAPAATVTVTPTPEPATTAPTLLPDDPRAGLDPADIDALFVNVLRKAQPSMFLGVDDTEVIALAHSACGVFDTGADFADAVTVGVSKGYTYGQMGSFLGSAIAAYCPEYTDLVQ